mmetsp:Transcript_3692/g.10525  ORF Transcript_3692/g.10525 Transcript_3692/m.10525 type:complete len:208 (-) Transcript_3692:400-1023(-)
MNLSPQISKVNLVKIGGRGSTAGRLPKFGDHVSRPQCAPLSQERIRWKRIAPRQHHLVQSLKSVSARRPPRRRLRPNDHKDFRATLSMKLIRGRPPRPPPETSRPASRPTRTLFSRLINNISHHSPPLHTQHPRRSECPRTETPDLSTRPAHQYNSPLLLPGMRHNHQRQTAARTLVTRALSDRAQIMSREMKQHAPRRSAAARSSV